MRVLLTGPARPGDLADLLQGAVPDHPGLSGSSVIGLLARTLRRRGHDVVVVTLSRYVHGGPVRYTGEGLEVRVGSYRERHRARDAFAAERRAVEGLIRDAGPVDVVHAHWTYEFALGALAAGRPTVVTVHDWPPVVVRFQPHPYRLVRVGMAARVLAASPIMTAVSPYLADLVARWTRRRPAIVPNGIPEEEFARAPAGPDPGPITLVALNDGFGRRKNVTVLLRALPHIRRGRPETRLRLLGRGYGPGEEAERWSRRHGLTDGVEFVGHVPRDVAMRHLARSHVFVHPSLEESFGLVLVEAMARRVPVVAGRRSGAVAWVCANGLAGALTDVRSPDALAETVLEVLERPERTAAMVAAAATQARRRFTADVNARGYEESYELAAGGAAG